MHWMIITAALLGMSCTFAFAAEPLPALRAEGSKMVDASGNAVVLRGCNLGSWLLTESWMLGWDVADQETLIDILTKRFGQSGADRLLTLYRDGFITPRDFELIKSFGFNVVRLPFDSRMLIDQSGTLRPDAFKYLDRALSMAEEAGVYVILDMHGAPGSQSTMDHTGQREQNKLWSDPKNQERMIELWVRLAQRYKDRTVVAAYDLLNEPYGDFKQDLRPALRELMPRLAKAIRATGDRHLLIFPNALGAGFTFYDPPEAQGLDQIGFTDHYYAGMFGSPSTVKSHAAMFWRAMPEAQAYADRVGGPVLIGEFNVVLEKTGGKAMLRRYFDEFAERGWMATMWSYKILKPSPGVQPDNWYLVTNAQPLPQISFETSSLSEIEGYFSELANTPLAVDEKLRNMLTEAKPAEVILPKIEPLPSIVPTERSQGRWQLVDVDTGIKAGLESTSDTISITAAGADIFGTRDSFTFLQQPASEKVVLTATVDHLLESGQWAKAGLMIRFGNPSQDDFTASPMAMVNTFADGGIAFVTRDRPGAPAKEMKRIIGPLPRKLALLRDGRVVRGYVDNGDDGWIEIGSVSFEAGGAARIGMAVSSQSKATATRADFSGIQLTPGGALSGPITPFAIGPIAKAASAPPMSTWYGWGNGFEIDGDTLRWHAAEKGESGRWIDLDVERGKTYAFSLRVQRAAEAPESQSLTACMEATLDGKQIALDEKRINVNQLETGDGWSVVRVQATAPSEKLRIILRAGASDAGGNSPLLVKDVSFAEVSDR